MRLCIQFPNGYPAHVAPLFTFFPDTTLPGSARAKIITYVCFGCVCNVLADQALNTQPKTYAVVCVFRVLQEAARQQVAHSRTCLEHCLRALDEFLDTLMQETAAAPVLDQRDDAIPFPRTSGAYFSPNG